MLKIFLIIISFALASFQTINKLTWSVCPGVTNVIDIVNLDVTPMVIFFLVAFY